MPIILVDFEHDQVTNSSGHRYLFTAKHHGGQYSEGQAQWLPSLVFADEFWVFNMADDSSFCDDDGTLYGLLKGPDTLCALIGTRDEQIAIFPRPNAGSPWHGYPVYPVACVKGRSGEAGRPKSTIFARMVEVGLLTIQEVTRLKKGKHI